ncbi:MAG: PAS domain S-box protein [Alphaproteobacteria bacterium]|nr:MAG: PAS domain S-box protein [Alphaproteobacteria bacterium]
MVMILRKTIVQPINKMKIGNKLALGFVGLALLMMGLGYFSLHTSQKTIEDAIGKNSADLTEQILEHITQSIYHRIEEIQTYATDELLRQYIIKSNSSFDNIKDLNDYIEQANRDWVNGIELPIITELNNNELAIELQSRQKFLEDKYGYPLLAEVFVTNKYGLNVAQTSKTTDYYQADEKWWQVAQKDGLFVNDVNYDESSGIFSTEISVRINDLQGNFLGVIKEVPNIREIINIINEAKLGAEYKTLEFYLLNKEGKIIYATKDHNNSEYLSNNQLNSLGILSDSRHDSYLINQDKILFAHAHSKEFKDFATNGWILISQINSSEVFAPINNLRKNMMFAAIIVLGLALFASSITYRSIIVPIAELQKATIQIASGDLNTNLVKSGSGEINQLANSFQRMAQRLKKTIDDLNDEIDGRKKTEDKIRENQQFLDNIINTIQDGIVVLDKNLNITKVNTWKEKIHADAMPLVGKKCYEVFHKRQEPCTKCPTLRAISTGKQQTEITSTICADNNLWWFELTASPIRDDKGNITGVIEHAKNITQHKHAEEVLHERECQLRSILENIQSGIFIIDPETHKIVDVNPIAAKLVGIPKEKLIGSICHNYICPVEKGSCPVTDLGQTVENSERALLISKGEKCPITKTVVKISFNGKEYLLESFIDISKYKQAEQALENLNKNLELTIDELSRSNRQLHDFVHVAAHDLKTPVRGIGTLADWIINDYGDKLNNQGREQIRLLKTRVVRIDKLIDGMLQFSKIVRTKHKERQINLNTLLSDIRNTLVLSDKIQVAIDSLPDVVSEREHIELVFQNLLGNAVNFMDKAKGMVKVGCVEQGDFWKFYVSDNGQGIEQKYFEKIFRIFQTLPKNDEPQTAGIGLAIVKKIVELSGGKIWVESQPENGSTFYFTFPKHLDDITHAAIKTYTVN